MLFLYSADEYKSPPQTQITQPLCATMLRHFLLILTIVLFGCEAGQKPEARLDDTSSSATISKVRYPTLTTTKCNQTQLSNQFDLDIDFKRYSDTSELNDSCVLSVNIEDKQTKENLDSFSLTSLFYFSTILASCDNVTSYTTQLNSDRQISDNYFGDIVVADLNFDKKDDIAVINDNGGNGGPLYSYYIQNDNNKFKIDSFLTDSMIFFPTIIDKKRFRMTTYVHAGACCMGEDIYQFDKLTKKWKHIKHNLLQDK